MKKRLVSMAFVMCVFICMTLLPIEVFANHSNPGGFRKTYTLTGNPVNDMIAIANAQVGRNDMGYWEGWCDNFISDCAILAGQEAAVPQASTVNDFYNQLINAGGTVVSYPQAGDIVIYYSNNTHAFHCGLMIDGTYNIEGNCWFDDTTSVRNSYVNKQAYTNYGRYISCYKKAFIRPNYVKAARTLDVNGYLDGADSHYIGDYGTFDVYINGSKVADDVNDYYRDDLSTGTSYKITDIKPKEGKAYQGYASGSDTITGTLDANRNVRLSFYTVDPVAFVNKYNQYTISTYNGHTYWYCPTATYWWTADIVARHLGGHLVTISSAGENSFIYNLGGNDKLWLGATDCDREGTWKWVNGESFSYSNWGSGEPNNSAGSLSGTQNYAVMWAREGEAGTWDDEDGSTPYPFVIEFDKAYTVLYNANGGTGAPAAQTKAYGKSLTLSSAVPTRSGYIFLGWATSSAATSASYMPGNVYSREANLTLYAVWKSIVQVSASSSQIIGNIGDSVNVTLTQTGGAVGGTWTAAGLPAGLSINPNTGVISGTLTTAGKGKFTVTYTTPEGKSGSAQVWYSVQKPGSNNYALYMETEKLGAYEMKFVVFDAEVKEHEGAVPRGMGPAPEGYGYYNATAKARIVFDSVNGKNAYPAGGGMVLRLGHSASGSAYESQKKMIENANVEIGSGVWVSNYLTGSNMTYEENADKARFGFAIGDEAFGVDEMGNKYYEFDISFSNMLAKPGDSFPLSAYAFVSGDGRVSISYQGYGGVIEKPVVVSVVSGSIDIPGGQQPPAPTDKLGAYEGRFTVFDAEATEEEPRYLGTLGLGEAPEGYGYYQLSARARLSYDETVAGMYPSGGIFMLAVGAAESGAVYPTQEALANNKLVSFEGDDKFGVYGSATNYVGSMTDEEAAGIYKARYAFAVGGDISSPDEAGNRYFEFDIILRGVLAKAGESFELKLDGWVNDGTGQISYQSSSGSISERMNVVESKSGVITIPEANGVLSFTKDDAETDAIKLLRWQGMDAEATGEPRNRGYDPTQTSDTVGIRLNGAPMAYSTANLAKAKELLKGVKYESLTYSGEVSQQVTESDGGLRVADKLSISFGSSGGYLTATVTALKPVAMRLTMADGSECLIATPGDVNLDGSMDANDWTTIMRWTLQASSRYDVTEYPNFRLNGQSFDLWALLADMTGTGVSGNRREMVDANDWTTIMYLTLQAWKK